MFLHLGGDISINEKYIVAICDLDNTSYSKITREYLNFSQKADEVITISDEDLPKSFVITEENGVKRVYITPISSQTLVKRMNNKEFI